MTKVTAAVIAILTSMVMLVAFAPSAQLRRATDYYFEVASGNVVSATAVNKFGQNVDVDTGSIEDIWDGGETWVEPTAARLHGIVSSDAVDATGNTGARTLKVFGLDTSGLEIDETISLSGTNLVTTTNSYSMIYRMVVLSAGSGGVNAGDITATADVDATVTAQVSTGNNQTLMAIYKIPASMQGCLIETYAATNKAIANSAANIYVYAKPPGEVWQVKLVYGLIGAGSSTSSRQYGVPVCFEELTLIKMAADVVSSNMDVSAGFSMVTVP